MVPPAENGRSVAPAVAEPAIPRQRRPAGGAACRRELALHDWIVAAFVVALAAAVLAAAPHPLKARAAGRMTALAAAVLGAIFAYRRGFVASSPFAAALLYRAGIVGGVLGSYFVLRDLAPVVSPHSLDRGLYALDLAIFGGEPAVWMQHFVTPASTEWFSFFYLSYFWLLAGYTLPIAFGVDSEAIIGEFAAGMIIVYCVGQTVYLVVPGFGPHAAFAELFPEPLPAGRWHDALMRTVAAAGAQKDIFPSLHTAGPVFLAVFAFRHRREPWARVAWPITAFVTANIALATLVLRWHYGVDVVAGVALGIAAAAAAAVMPAADAARRRARGAGPLWPPLRVSPPPADSAGGECQAPRG